MLFEFVLVFFSCGRRNIFSVGKVGYAFLFFSVLSVRLYFRIDVMGNFILSIFV